jgi:hypothetical protein
MKRTVAFGFSSASMMSGMVSSRTASVQRTNIRGVYRIRFIRRSIATSIHLVMLTPSISALR